MSRNPLFISALLATSLIAGGCRPGPNRVADERESAPASRDTTSPSYKAGEAAHEIVHGAEKAVKAAGRKIDESAKKAREGWKDKAEEDREKREAARP